MKNIHVLPTDKPSRLRYNLSNVLVLTKGYYNDYDKKDNQNIFITSDEEIKEGDYYIDYSIKTLVEIHKLKVKFGSKPIDCKKIILTTDLDLRSEDSVQAIPDEFLEWFVHNPSCEWVEVKKGKMKLNDDGEEYGFPDMSLYKIIIPKEEPKQERMYSEEDMREAFYMGGKHIATEGKIYEQSPNFETWVEQFKKK